MPKHTPAAQLERTADLAEDMEVPLVHTGNLNPGGSVPYTPRPHRFAAVEARADRTTPYHASPFAEASWRCCASAGPEKGSGTGDARARSRRADAADGGAGAGASERDGAEGGLGGCRAVIGAACWGAPGGSDPSYHPATVGVMCGGLVGAYDLAAGTIAVRFGEGGRVRKAVSQRLIVLLFRPSNEYA